MTFYNKLSYCGKCYNFLLIIKIKIEQLAISKPLNLVLRLYDVRAAQEERCIAT